mgnify:CR=1 FL=1
MGGPADQPLTVDAAKARLRAVARRRSLAAWVREHPMEGLLAGFAAGAVSGATPETRRLLTRLLERMF